VTETAREQQGNEAWRDAVRRLQWHLYCRDIEPHRASLSAYCLTLARDRASADDLMQESLLRAFRVVAQFSRGLDKPGAYLARIARNLWIDRLREARRADAWGSRVGERPDTPAATVAPPAYPAEHLLQRLSERERQVFVLQAIYGYTGAEIGSMLGISHAAAKMAGHRARRKLKTLYDEGG